MCEYRMKSVPGGAGAAACRLLLLLLFLVSSCMCQMELRDFLPELCVFAEPQCPNTRITFWLYTKWVAAIPTNLTLD